MQQSSNRVSQRLGNYHLLQQVGRGGFAEVYLGEHIHLKTQVAVKVLLNHLTQEAVEPFRREAQTIARLRHPSIVQIHDFGIEADTAYLVMDYAPHGTLRQLQPKGNGLPLVTVVTYVKQVAEALQYAHEQRLIHRDVKPENMLLGSRHEVLLSDFGIALAAHSSASQSTQNIAGTIVYMAPEQIHGHPCPASDQYALGIVVYEWLCGRRPFQGTFTEIALQHSIKAPPSLRLYLPTIPSEIEQIVMTALQKDPLQRFPNVRVFAQALEQACLRQNTAVAMSTFYMPSIILAPPSASLAVPQLSAPQQTPPGLQQDPVLSSKATRPSAPYATTALAVTADPPLAVSGVLRPDRPQRRFSRRGVMIGIAGLVAAASSGLTWIVLWQRAPNPTSMFSGETPNNSHSPLIPATASLVTYRGHSDDVVGVDWSFQV